MIFRVESRLFMPGMARVCDLLMLLRSAASRGHTLLVVDDPTQVDMAESEVLGVWAGSLADPLRSEVAWLCEAIHRIPPNVSTRGASCVLVTQSSPPSTPWYIHLDLRAAIRLASMPLFILVEDAVSDAAFLRRTLPPRWRARLKEWERDGFVQFEHGGGVDAMKRIIEHCTQGRSDPLGLGSATWRCAHVVLCDRDSKEDRDGEPSLQVRQLQATCRRTQMQDRLHVLERRDQEAYLPREALDAIIAKAIDAAKHDTARDSLDLHFAKPDRHHAVLPHKTWFKSAFLRHDQIAWDDAWFERDNSEPEMIDLVEKIAAFL